MTLRPDFFIAGAAKCGTTALTEYLAAHASVFIPRIKEPNFFCTDLKAMSGVRTIEEYESLFACVPEQCVSGEASALYLYSRVAIEQIMERNPRAKVITMLRYPVDAAHSLHAARWSLATRTWRTSRTRGDCSPRVSRAHTCRAGGPIQ